MKVAQIKNVAMTKVLEKNMYLEEGRGRARGKEGGREVRKEGNQGENYCQKTELQNNPHNNFPLYFNKSH